MKIPPDDYELLEWWPASNLAPPGVKIWVELTNGEIDTAIRHGHIPTRSAEDLGYRQHPTGNAIEIVKWAHS